MRIPVCKLNFRQFSATGLDTFSQLVLAGIYENTTPFATPPIDEANYKAKQQDFLAAYVEYDKYGPVKKTNYLNAKKAMVNILNTLAVYVDSVAFGDASIIILSGFEPSREQPQPSQPVPQINNFSVKRSDSIGEIVINIASLTNYGMVNYGCVCVEGQPLAEISIVNGQLVFPQGGPVVRYDLNKTRRKVFSNLTVGKIYYFYVFGINSVSVSPISGVRQLMAA